MSWAWTRNENSVAHLAICSEHCVEDLVTSIYLRFPLQRARQLVRQRIYTEQAPSIRTIEFVKIHAKRVSFCANPSSLSLVEIITKNEASTLPLLALEQWAERPWSRQEAWDAIDKLHREREFFLSKFRRFRQPRPIFAAMSVETLSNGVRTFYRALAQNRSDILPVYHAEWILLERMQELLRRGEISAPTSISLVTNVSPCRACSARIMCDLEEAGICWRLDYRELDPGPLGFYPPFLKLKNVQKFDPFC